MNQNFKFFLETMGHLSCGLKRRGTIQLVISRQSASLMVWSYRGVYNLGSSHTCKGTINAEKYKEVLEQHMLQFQTTSLRGRSCILQQDNDPTYFIHHNSMALNIWKHMVQYKNKTTTMKVQDCWAATILHQTKMRQHSSSQTPSTGMLVNITLFLTFLRCVAAIKVKMR